MSDQEKVNNNEDAELLMRYNRSGRIFALKVSLIGLILGGAIGYYVAQQEEPEYRQTLVSVLLIGFFAWLVALIIGFVIFWIKNWRLTAKVVSIQVKKPAKEEAERNRKYQEKLEADQLSRQKEYEKWKDVNVGNLPVIAKDFLAELIPDESFDKIGVGCWKSASSKAETMVGDFLLAGIGGGAKIYEFGYVMMNSTSQYLYLVSCGQISGAEVNNGELTVGYLQSKASKVKQSGKMRAFRYDIALLEVYGEANNEYVMMKIAGSLKTELTLFEKFVPGNVEYGIDIVKTIDKKNIVEIL